MTNKTTAPWSVRRDRMSKRFYKLIAAGKYEEADKLMKKMVDEDVKHSEETLKRK